MQKKKAVIWTLVGFASLASMVLLAMRVQSAAFKVIQAEQDGAAYQTFFVAVELYTQENGRIPESFDDLLDDEGVILQWSVGWEEFPSYLKELIEPNFSIIPSTSNLNMFAPDDKITATWAHLDCESAWNRIVENCKISE